MAKFIVDLELQIGEYEKGSVHVIDAPTKSHAMLQALADESHGNANMDSCDGVWWDMGGEMAYSVRSCREVSEDVVKTLVKDIGCFHESYFDPDQIIELLADDADTHDIDEMLGYLK
jgi:hypothetical protein